MKRISSFICAILIVLISHTAGLGMETVLYDHFDDGSLDPDWNISFADGAIGWTYTESGTDFSVTDIQTESVIELPSPPAPWPTVSLSRSFTPLDDFLNRLRECPQVNRVYLTPPPNIGSHFKEKGWEILELHVVPIGRPPYFEIEKVFGTVPKAEDAISEMIRERAFLKVGNVYLVRIIEQPIRLGHV